MSHRNNTRRNNTRRKYNSRQNSRYSLPRNIYNTMNVENSRFNTYGRPRKQHNSNKNRRTLRANAKVFVPRNQK